MKRKGRRERSKVRVSRIFLFSIFDQELTSLEAKGGAAGWKESRNVDKFASNEIGNNRRICSVRRLPCRWGGGGGYSIDRKESGWYAYPVKYYVGPVYPPFSARSTDYEINPLPNIADDKLSSLYLSARESEPTWTLSGCASIIVTMLLDSIRWSVDPFTWKRMRRE